MPIRSRVLLEFLSAILILMIAFIFPITIRAEIDEEFSQLSNLSLEGLMQVTIATKTPRFKKDVTSTVHIFTSGDIKKHGWLYLSELLRHVPGVDLVQTGSGVIFSARGVADLSPHGNKTVIMIDGHNTQFSVFNSSNYFGFQNDINLAAAKKVEVQVGPAGTLHGANAFGLVVDIITHEPGELEGTTLSLSAGTDQESVPSLTWGNTHGKWSEFLSGTYWDKEPKNLSEIMISETPGYQIYNNSAFHGHGLRNSSADGYLDFNKEIRLGFHMMHSDNGFGSIFVTHEAGNLSSNKEMIFLDVNHKFTKRVEYKLKTHYLTSAVDSGNTEFIATSGGSHGSVNAGGYSLVLDNQIIFSQNDQNVWLSGLYYELSRQRPNHTTMVPSLTPVNAPYFLNEENWDNYAGYVQWEWKPFSSIYFVSGIRYVNSIEQYSYAFLPHFGLNFQFLEYWNLKLNYQKGYRPPSPSEAGAIAPFIQPNPNLLSEFINTYEMTLEEVPNIHHHYWLTYFYSEISNFIILTPVSSNIYTYQNQSSLITNGLELGSRYRLREDLFLDGSFTFTRSFDNSTNSETQTIIPYKMNLSMNWLPRSGWSLTFDNYLRIDPRTEPGNLVFSGNNASSWILSNLTLVIHDFFSVSGFTGTIGIRNLFDREYGLVSQWSPSPYLSSYNPQERRSEFMTLEYHFK